jgi:hypothetical protein
LVEIAGVGYEKASLRFAGQAEAVWRFGRPATDRMQQGAQTTESEMGWMDQS